MSSGKTMQRRIVIRHHKKNMIHVEYEQENNYPHDRELILFDRNAFQQLHRDILSEVNKKYNILCPDVFVIECIAPNRASERSRRSLREKLELIDNPIVLVSNTTGSEYIKIDFDHPTILTSEQIAQSCITNTPIRMERVAPKKLIFHHETRMRAFKSKMESLTKACDAGKGALTSTRLSSRVQRRLQEEHNVTTDIEEIKDRINVKQELNYVAEDTLRDIENESKFQSIKWLKEFLNLTDEATEMLSHKIRIRKSLTPENYPDLAYPIYIYYLIHYIINARQYDTKHLDKSYVRDIRYLHYLNFCDIFVADETSTEHIVKSMPYSNIKATPVITSKELQKRLI